MVDFLRDSEADRSRWVSGRHTTDVERDFVLPAEKSKGLSKVEERSQRRKTRQQSSASTQAESVLTPELSESGPKEQWKEPLEDYLSAGKDIEDTNLKKSFTQYLSDYYGVSTSSELDKVFKKDPEFSCTEKDEKNAFNDYLLDNFVEWKKSDQSTAKESVEKPEKIFVLSLNPKKYESFFDDVAKEGLKKFLRLLPIATRVSINAVRNGNYNELKTIGIEANVDGSVQKAYLSATLTRAVYNNCGGFRADKGNGPVVGLRFFYSDGTFQFIAADSKPETVKDILSRVDFDGTHLPKEFDLEFNLPKR